MIPEETDFWQRVRFALRERGLDLFLIAHHHPSEPFDVPLVNVTNGLDSGVEIPRQNGWGEWAPPQHGLDERFLLQREQSWRGGETNEVDLLRRRRSLYNYRSFYASVLESVRPALTVIWNGEHPQELILADLCRACHCPVAYIERAPFKGMLQLDREGILAESSAALAEEWTLAGPDGRQRWLAALDTITSDYLERGATWWEQPETTGPDEIRKKLGIPSQSKVVLFAGQVDEDAQNILFSPHFAGTLGAFEWFCDHLPEGEGLFVLGKHHPRSSSPLESFASAADGRGVWTNETSLEDCLAIADYVATVNSTVMYEGLMKGLPVFSLGKSLLSGKGIVHELSDLDSGSATISKWLDDLNGDARRDNWRKFGAWLLANAFYSMSPSGAESGLRDAKDFSATLDAWHEGAQPDYNLLPPEFLPFAGTPGRLQKALGMPRRVFSRARRLCSRRFDDSLYRLKRSGSPLPTTGELSGRSMLVVSHVRCWNPDMGSRLRVAGLIRGLARRGLEIDMIFLGDLHQGERNLNLADVGLRTLTCIPSWRQYCAGSVDVDGAGAVKVLLDELRGRPHRKVLPPVRRPRDFDSPDLSRFIAGEYRRIQPDFLLTEYVQFTGLLGGIKEPCISLVDTIDVMSARCRSFEEAGKEHHLNISESEEADLLAYHDVVIAINEEDAGELKRLAPGKCVVTVLPGIENADVDFAWELLEKPDNLRALFVGADNMPNRSGLRNFLRDVWPRVVARFPTATFEVCGGVCEGFEGNTADGVIWRGRTDDLAPMYKNAALVINPVEIGGGMKIKTLEGLSYGRPVVATPHAATGFPDLDDSGLVVVCDSLHFVNEISKLLEDPGRRIARGRLAAKYVRSRFSIDVAVDDLVCEMVHRTGTESGDADE